MTIPGGSSDDWRNEQSLKIAEKFFDFFQTISSTTVILSTTFTFNEWTDSIFKFSRPSTLTHTSTSFSGLGGRFVDWLLDDCVSSLGLGWM
jgi:hypothetical protein